jgi:hypothetical protein
MENSQVTEKAKTTGSVEKTMMIIFLDHRHPVPRHNITLSLDYDDDYYNHHHVDGVRLHI